MARRIFYKVENEAGNTITEVEWEEVMRLQHWYNSEFVWSSGRLAFRRYVLFPNTEEFADLDHTIWEILSERYRRLKAGGKTEWEIISQLEKDGLVFVKWGGYADGCLASGFTRVADNEWNAYLVCDFLLKVSLICRRATIIVNDEGKFIKPKSIALREGVVQIPEGATLRGDQLDDWIARRHVFSIVNPVKYDRHPAFKYSIPEFSSLTAEERLIHLKNWNWLGYDDRYDVEGDDTQGYNLNLKVKAFRKVS